MARDFLSKSYDLQNIAENDQAQVGQWLMTRKVAFEFKAASGGFDYVKLDEKTMPELRAAFPNVEVAQSAFRISFDW